MRGGRRSVGVPRYSEGLMSTTYDARHLLVLEGLEAVRKRFEKVPQKLTSVRYKNGKPLEHKLVVQVIAESKDRLGKEGRLVLLLDGLDEVG